MPLTAILFFGVIFVAGSIVASLFALSVFGQSSKAVRERIAVGSSAVVRPASASAPVIRAQRVNSGVVRFFASATSITKIERNVMLAGRPDSWTLRRVIIAKPVMTMMGLLVLYTFVSKNPSGFSWIIGGMAVVAGYFAPDILLQKRAEARQEAIQQELPDILDQVTISIEAGLGFEAAFARIGERRSGPLAEEIVRTVQDMRLGMSRRDAYQSMAARTDVDDLRRFVKSIVQAEQFGVSIASVVRTQAVEMRFKRRTRAEGRALKVPVKILFPLLVCILPVLFIVVLTPAVISLTSTTVNR